MSKRATKTLRHLARIGLGLIMFVVVLLVVTTIYQSVATAAERARFRPPGRLVDVGGYRLHLRCEGKGSPTVVLESGGGMTSNEWTLVQPEVATFTRVCSYDRAGLGWSESGPPADPVQVLRALLRKGEVPALCDRRTLVLFRSRSQVCVSLFKRGQGNGAHGGFVPDEEVQRIRRYEDSWQVLFRAICLVHALGSDAYHPRKVFARH